MSGVTDQVAEEHYHLWMSPGVSHGRVTTPAGLESRANVHMAPTLPCSMVQKLGVQLPAHHSLPWDVQGTPPERPHHSSSRRREGETSNRLQQRLDAQHPLTAQHVTLCVCAHGKGETAYLDRLCNLS
jgi:hypothetical protein